MQPAESWYTELNFKFSKSTSSLILFLVISMIFYFEWKQNAKEIGVVLYEWNSCNHIRKIINSSCALTYFLNIKVVSHSLVVSLTFFLKCQNCIHHLTTEKVRKTLFTLDYSLGEPEIENKNNLYIIYELSEPVNMVYNLSIL